MATVHYRGSRCCVLRCLCILLVEMRYDSHCPSHYQPCQHPQGNTHEEHAQRRQPLNLGNVGNFRNAIAPRGSSIGRVPATTVPQVSFGPSNIGGAVSRGRWPRPQSGRPRRGT
jgi:hypothetical protein